jgi:hypothetical protein
MYYSEYNSEDLNCIIHARDGMHIKTRNQALRRANSLISRYIAKHKDKTKLQCLYELRKHKKYKHCNFVLSLCFAIKRLIKLVALRNA